MTDRRATRALVLAAFAVAITVPVMLGSAAGAQTTCVADATYNPSATFSVSPSQAAAGSTVTFTGSGWPANSGITITVGGVNAGIATTNASGSFSMTYTLPTSLSGNVTATAGCGQLQLSTTLGVTAAGGGTTGSNAATTGASSGSLPYTGSDTIRYAGVGLALLAAGGLLVFVSRKRRPAPVEA